MIKVVILIFISIGLAGCKDSDLSEQHYANYSQVTSDHAIDRGWVPDWLPANATNIYELHNIDTNYSMLRFSFPAGTELKPPSACAQIDPSKAPQPRYSRSWWPRDVPPSSFVTHRHVFLLCGETYIAFSNNQGEGFAWQ
jgi:hypothetical protein